MHDKEQIPRDAVTIEIAGKKLALGSNGQPFYIPVVEKAVPIKEQEQIMSSWPILVNPNRCPIGWQKKSVGEHLVNSRNGIFPNAGSEAEMYYAKTAKNFGFIDSNGQFHTNRGTSAQTVEEVETEVLFVDCSNHPLNAKTVLVDIKYDKEEIRRMKRNSHRVIHSKRRIRNWSIWPQTEEIHFHTNTQENNATVYQKDESLFIMDGATTEAKEKMAKFMRDLGVNPEPNGDATQQFQEALSQHLFNTIRSPEKEFKLNKVLALEPRKTMKVKIFSDVYKGIIPFKSVYLVTLNDKQSFVELLAAVNDVSPPLRAPMNVMKKSEKEVIIEYEGAAIVEAGHEIKDEVIIA